MEFSNRVVVQLVLNEIPEEKNLPDTDVLILLQAFKERYGYKIKEA